MVLLTSGFILLCTSAVWASTGQRIGTADELRTVAAAFQALLILAGVAWML